MLIVGALAFLGRSIDVMLLLGSFGASCVLLFGYPDAPFAQPMNVVGGHVICTVVGLAASHWIGPQPWVLALAVGCSIAAMMATRTVHPPAGSNPVIVFLGHSGWGFLDPGSDRLGLQQCGAQNPLSPLLVVLRCYVGRP